MPALKESSPSQRIAVTGANGFIGAHCVIALLAAGFRVVAIVRDPTDDEKTGFLKNEAAKLGKQDELSFAAGDLFQKGSYDDAFQGCHGVLHTAAVVEIGNVDDPERQIVRPSVEGTENVLASIAKMAHNTLQRYVHISSVAAIQSLEKPADHVFTEKDWNVWSTIETDPYGYGKTKAEQMVWDQKEELTQSNVDIVVLNPVISLGPCLCKAHTKSSTVFLRQILYSNPVLNYNGSFVDVRDVAQAVVAAFLRDTAADQRFLLCGTPPMNTMELSTITKRVYPWVKGSSPKVPPMLLSILISMGKALPFLQGVGPVPTEFQAAMCQRLITCDASKSKEILGVKYTSIEDTCRDSVDSMKPFVKISNWGAMAENKK